MNIDLKNIKEILKKVTKGPWVAIIEGRDQDSGSSFIMTGNENDRDYDINFDNIREADLDFIAIARNILPELTEELESLRNQAKG